MARVARSLALAAVCAGCSGESAAPVPPPQQQPPAQDAGVDGVTVLPSVDPASGMHLDEGPGTARVAPSRPKNRPSRPIDITLKSEPPGALAAVDGRPIGTTPTFWPGESDGLDHEFTFTLAGHASARYRFVPITSGVLHVKLQPVTEEGPGSGSGNGLEPVIAPKLAPEPAPPAPGAPSSSPPAPSAAPAPSPSAPPAPEPAPTRPSGGGFGPPP